MNRWIALPCALLCALPASGAVAASPSPADEKIALARRHIEAHPGRFEPYNALALALARRARETGDPAYYRQAEEALARSLELAPGNFEGKRTRVWVLLGRHEFARALEEAEALNRQAPDDLLTYALLADARVELGHYREAEEAVQWMLDLRPGNLAGLTRGAYLRELFGDLDGAIEWMGEAYERTPPDEVEDRAWILTQLAHLHLASGEVDGADALLDRALDLFPGYHYALAQLARVRRAQQRHPEAVELLRARYRAAPHPENLYELAEALVRAGGAGEARPLFAEFEEQARRESGGWDNANRELIFYYADRAGRPADALALAAREIARRRDVATLDAYAWALHVNGRDAEAREAIEAALAVGIRDARTLYHAGVIAAALGDREAAERTLRKSLTGTLESDLAAAARGALASLEAPGSSAPKRATP